MDIVLDSNEKIKLIKKVKKLLVKIPYITISTIDLDGNPWLSPVNSAYDENFNFYFKSPIDTEHSKYLEKNNNISWVLFDSRAMVGTGIGIYFKGKMYELNENEIDEVQKGSDLIAERVGKIGSLAMKFLKINPRRVYKCIPEKIWINSLKIKGLEVLDGKVEITLEELLNN